MRGCKRVTVEIVGLALAATLFQAPSAYPAGQAATDFEISLHELGKVRKGLPAKRKPADRRKRKKSNAIQEKAAPAATDPQESGSRIHPPASSSSLSAAPESQQPRNPAEPTPENRPPAVETPDVGLQAALAEKPRISHDPYSYLVAGKRTVILAVISSVADIKAVYCKFRVEEKGEDAIAPMIKVDGTQYTYRAILPGLAPSSRSLRYRLVAVDTLGVETQSREFFTAVKTSPVMPGWQLEDSPESLATDQPATVKPLENPPGQPPAR